MKRIKTFWIVMSVLSALLCVAFVADGLKTMAICFTLLFVFWSLILYFLCRKHYADYNAVSAELIDETEIITKQAEKTGFSIHYHGNISTSQHYQYKDVVTGYRCTFLVKYENGKERKVKCRHGDKVYQKLCKVNGIAE